MNWKLARDWEVIDGARKGYPEAINEAARRGLTDKLNINRPAGVYFSKLTR